MMGTSALLNTSTPTLGELFSNGRTYSIPRYQRDYGWSEENWEELWLDIHNAHTAKSDHYMGAIVLQVDGDRKQSTVIDGQQRLVTVSLLALSVVSYLSELAEQGFDVEGNRDRMRLVRDRFLSSKNAASLLESSRLRLNRRNDPFFAGILLQLSKPHNIRREPISNRLLWAAYEYFKKRLQNQFETRVESGRRASEFLDAAADRLLFIQIIVNDELNAYTVFETLNARGTPLTVTDILKNYLFSRFKTDSDLDLVDQRWDATIGLVDHKDFPAFLRHYWNSRNPLVRRQELFREIRRAVSDAPRSLALMNELERTAGLHHALDSPDDPFWGGERQVKNRIRELKLFDVSQCYPLLFSAHEKIPAEFEAILKICSVISFRYIIVSRLNTQPMERAYASAALAVNRGQLKTAREVFAALSDIYVGDDAFKRNFSVLSLDYPAKKSLIKYVLITIENHLAASNRNWGDDLATIEHILPRSAEAAAEHFSEFGEFSDTFTSMLGNYALLEEAKNRDCADKSYADKRPIYGTSQYTSTSKIAWQSWNPEALTARQDFLTDQAAAIWKIS